MLIGGLLLNRFQVTVIDSVSELFGGNGGDVNDVGRRPYKVR